MKNFFNYYYVTKKNVYFLTDNDEVKEGKVVAQDIITKEEGNDLVTLTIEDETKEQHKLSYKLCYATIEDYRKNNPITLSEGHFSRIKGINDAGDKPMYYYIENGQVVMGIVDIKNVHIDCSPNRDIFSSPEVPTDKQIFSDPEVAEQMCTTTWTDENGKQHTKEGLLSLILLDDEQKAAVQALRAALQRCNELKVGIGFHTDSCHLYAWSKAKVKDAYFTYDGDEGEKALFYDDEVFDNFNTDMQIEYVGYDDEMRVIRKDEDEQPQQAE